MLGVVLASWGQYTVASGAFVPGVGANVNNEYSQGKALIHKTIEGQTCKTCHSSFKRSKLIALDTTVGKHLLNCNSHNPCYEGNITPGDADAISVYFKKRYNMW